MPDEATATIDDDSTVYVKLFHTADFDAKSLPSRIIWM